MMANYYTPWCYPEQTLRQDASEGGIEVLN